MTLAPLTDEQLEAARLSATAARRRRAEIKAELRSRQRGFADVLALADTDEAIAQLRVVELLKCLNRVGDKKAQAVMTRLGIAENRRVRGLGPQQRANLSEFFAAHETGRTSR